MRLLRTRSPAMRHVLRQLMLAVAASALVSTMAWAQAAGPHAAFAVSTVTGAYGAAWKQSDQRAAERAAVRTCSSRARGVPDCRPVLTFQGVCGALAMDPRNRWGAETGATINEAGANALAACRQGGQACKVQQAVCAGG